MRSKLNTSTSSKNFKINKGQHHKDIPLYDRIDEEFDKQNQKDIYNVLFRPKNDQGAFWMSSLR